MSLETLFENLSISPLVDSDEESSPSTSQIVTKNNIQVSNKIIKSNSNLLLEMAQFKPEYLSCVPQFDGNPNELNRFLGICDSIITTFYDATNPNSFHNVFLLHSLISKLDGNAKLVVNIQNVTTWTELKDTLYRNFADQRDESCLNRDLVLLRQYSNEKPQQFFDRCLQILNLLCSYVDIHEQNDAAKALKRDLYNKLTLKTFLSGLKEPLGTTIRCMRPIDMNQALQFISQEDNIQYYQNSTNKMFAKQTPTQTKPAYQQHKQNNNFNRPMNNFSRNSFNNHIPFNYQTQNNQFRQQSNNFPSQPINVQPKVNYQPQKFFTNSQVFRQPNHNVFKPNPYKTFPNPTPMSGVSKQTSNNFQQKPSTSQYKHPQRNFTPEELYNAEVDEIDEQNLTNEYDAQNIDESHQDEFYQNEFCQDETYYDENPNFHPGSSTNDQT